MIRQFTSAWTETTWDVANVASAGNVVFAERVDRIRSSNGNVDLPCAGVFEMEDGKIKEWRDYFDMATFTKAMAG